MRGASRNRAGYGNSKTESGAAPDRAQYRNPCGVKGALLVIIMAIGMCHALQHWNMPFAMVLTLIILLVRVPDWFKKRRKQCQEECTDCKRLISRPDCNY